MLAFPAFVPLVAVPVVPVYADVAAAVVVAEFWGVRASWSEFREVTSNSGEFRRV